MTQLTSEADVPGVTIRRLESSEEIAASQALRFRVWSEQEGVLLKDMESGRIADEHDARAYHWGAFDRETLIGSARLTFHHDLASVPDAELFEEVTIPLPTASLNRLVVSRSVRGGGIAMELDKKRVMFARKSDMKSAIIAPIDKPSRVAALEASGFVSTNKHGVAKWSNMPIVSMYLVL
jgi:hypothetical protein